MSPGYTPALGPIQILHQDKSLLLVSKPAGLLSVPGKGAGLADCLLYRLQADDPSTLLIHRLDRDTSGIMVFARTASAQRHLGLQFERRHVTKHYTAIVKGHPEAECGNITLPLTSDWPNRPRQKVCQQTGRPSRTQWKVLDRYQDGTARLTLTPHTGRSHQLRVHLGEIGHPILGDPLYGPLYGAPDARRLMLHATRLALRHPEGGAPMTFTAPDAF